MKKTTINCVSALSAVALLSGCTTLCSSKPNAIEHHHHKNKAPVVFYQTYEGTDINKVSAKMYTHSSQGGESKMGYIKFHETDSGLKMVVNLQDLRPNKTYKVKIYQCNPCNGANMCCDKDAMNIDLPHLTHSHDGQLEESYIIRGLTATQLKNAKICLERDGGYKAAWGTLN